MRVYILTAAPGAVDAVFLLLQSLLGIAAVMGLIGLALWAVGKFAAKKGQEHPREDGDEKHDKQA